MDVLVTGAGGYVGRAIARVLAASGFAVTGGVRNAAALPAGVAPLVTGDLAATDVDLAGFGMVIHAAGLAHQRSLPKAVWWQANVAASVRLADSAKAAGVKRFVLISSLGVHGRAVDGVITEVSPTNPMDDYAASKLAAEQALAAILGPAMVVIRPAAVIGPLCPGNLPLLLRVLAKRVPLPLGSIKNARSFIAMDDLARLVLAVLQADTPPGLLLAAHPIPIATPDLVRALAAGLHVPARLLPCPTGLLAAGASLLGRKPMWQSLAGTCVVVPSLAQSLGWRPAESLEESLISTGRNFVVT